MGAKVKPGLSTFKTHPQDLKEFISPLFKEAQTLVPQSEWSKTPVYIKATAGMRLVTEEQARVIYDTIYAHLSSSPDICPFSVRRNDLKTITGTEEGEIPTCLEIYFVVHVASVLHIKLNMLI